MAAEKLDYFVHHYTDTNIPNTIDEDTFDMNEESADASF